ncbi:MAG: PLP-dependent aminotransferase family protein [Clostridia bacterium]|nr:PLP-dependent aminotransferase family protein [Clostridia bacterium]
MTYQFSNKIASLKPSAIREILKAPKDADTITLAAGNPAPETFPVADLARFAADIFANDSTTALQYGATDGYEPLRRAVAERQKTVWGIGKSVADGDSFNDTTIIVSGGNQGIELAAKVFCNEGDTVICENPTFIGGLNAFRSCGYNTVGVPIEEDGMNVQALEETIKATPNAKLLYIIPTFQNPAGITTSLTKRKAIYEVCKKYGLMILEDNPYGELRFAGEEIPTIKSFDTEGLVIYCSSFSKILSAGMRVGFVVAPEEVAAKMVVAKQSEDVHTNQFFQMLCYKFMTECDLDAHIAMIREVYGRKCKLMLDCLEAELPAAVRFTRPEGGLFIWVTLPEGVDASAFLKACMAEKLMIVPGATFNCDVTEGSMSFRLNYSTPSDEQIKEGVARLGKVAREFVK